MVGIVIGYLYFIFILIVKSYIEKKAKHPRIWLALMCFVGSLVLGCICVKYFSSDKMSELTGFTFMMIPLTFFDGIFSKPRSTSEKTGCEEENDR